MRMFLNPSWIVAWTPAHVLFDQFFPRRFHGKHRAVTA